MWWSSIPKDVKNKASLYLFVLGIVFGSISCIIYIHNPLKILIDELSELKPNSFAFELWKKPPYIIFDKAYIFNVTNSEAFLSGKEKLSFKEVGPYVYKETWYNTNVSFNNNGTVSFMVQRKMKFVPELSIGDPWRDTLILPNIPLLGLISSLAERSFLIKLAVGQVSLGFSNDEFVNLTVNDYLFGYNDDLIALANQLLPNWIDFSRFGIADRLLALDNEFNVLSMVINSTEYPDIGMYTINEFNGSPQLPQWIDDKRSEDSNCGLIKGCYLGTLFPPNIKKNATLVVYRHGFCRPLPLHYNHSDTTKYGFETYNFTINDNVFDTPEENPNNTCYCLNPPCLLQGISDISPCYYNMPVTLSHPHFLKSDPKILKSINGLSPDLHKHNFYMVIHPESGLPFEVKFRLQINLKVPETRFNYKTRPFNNLILPLLWFELSVDNPPTQIKIIINLFYVILPLVQKIVMVIFGVFGVCLPIVAVWIFFSQLCIKHDYLMLNLAPKKKIQTSSIKM